MSADGNKVIFINGSECLEFGVWSNVLDKKPLKIFTPVVKSLYDSISKEATREEVLGESRLVTISVLASRCVVAVARILNRIHRSQQN